jgi:putative DNA primase/helicase
MDDCCERNPQAWESASRLFESWSAWAVKSGEQIGSMKRFAERLDARGIASHRKKNGRGFVGLRLQSWQL